MGRRYQSFWWLVPVPCRRADTPASEEPRERRLSAPNSRRRCQETRIVIPSFQLSSLTSNSTRDQVADAVFEMAVVKNLKMSKECSPDILIGTWIIRIFLVIRASHIRVVTREQSKAFTITLRAYLAIIQAEPGLGSSLWAIIFTVCYIMAVSDGFTPVLHNAAQSVHEETKT